MTSPAALPLLACAGLIAAAGAGLLLLRGQAGDKRLRQRLAEVKSSHERAAQTEVTLFDTEEARTLSLDKITGLLGFSLRKRDQYPLQWWLMLLLAWVAACLIGWIALGFFGAFIETLVPVLWVLLSRMAFGFVDNRRKDKLFRQFPDALAMVVRSVRVGIPVTEAIRAVAREAPLPTGPEFARLGEEISIGVPLDQALHTMAERNDMAEYRFFATALTLQAQTGGTLSETLENLADVIRKRVALRERGNALASEAKTSAMVLAALPGVAALGLWFLNPQYLNVLFTTPTGHALLGGCLALLGTGIFVMRTIIRKSLQ